jgi:hypothetical protein
MNDAIFRTLEQQFIEAIAKQPPRPNRTRAQLKASMVVEAMETFTREIELVYGRTGIDELQTAREHVPLVRELLTDLANQLGDALGAREQLVAHAGQMADAIDWDLRERIMEERSNEHQYRREA